MSTCIDLEYVYNNDESEINQCLICYDGSNEAPLLKGIEIYTSSCNCNYTVHSECIQRWSQQHNADRCICCNSRATIKILQPEILVTNNTNTNTNTIESICCNTLLIIMMCTLTVWFIMLSRPHIEPS